MAFTTRSTRDTLWISKDLMETPGPGSFTQPSTFEKKSHFALAPFSSTSKRAINETKSEAPGPGQYYHEERYVSPLQEPSSNFKSKTGRFTHNPSNTPAPGDYYKPNEWIKTRRTSSAKNNDSSVQWIKVSTAPSIPDREQSHGYEEGSSGELIRQHAPVKGHSGKGLDTVGPGEYNTNGLIQNNWDKVKGQSSFKSKTKRGIFNPKDNLPAPGQYFPDEKKKKEDPFYEESKNNSSFFASKTNRSNWNSKNDPTIGPGSYIDPYKHATSFKVGKIPDRFQNFGSSSIRMSSIDSGLISQPGPGHFIKDPSTIGKQNSIFPVNNVGSFGSTSERFQKTNSQIDVGPGQYEDTSFIQDVQKKSKIGTYGVFGSTSRRFENIKSQTPSVGAYNPTSPEKWNLFKKNDPRSSVFASKSKREGLINTNLLENPSPGDYFKPTTWIKSSISKKDGEFGVKEPRVPTFIQSNGTTENPNLAPGRYQDFGSFCRTMNKKSFTTKPTVFSSSPRFEKPKVPRKWYDNYEPAPGSYEAKSQWVKTSFNVTID